MPSRYVRVDAKMLPRLLLSQVFLERHAEVAANPPSPPSFPVASGRIPALGRAPPTDPGVYKGSRCPHLSRLLEYFPGGALHGVVGEEGSCSFLGTKHCSALPGQGPLCNKAKLLIL